MDQKDQNPTDDDYPPPPPPPPPPPITPQPRAPAKFRFRHRRREIIAYFFLNMIYFPCWLALLTTLSWTFHTWVVAIIRFAYIRPYGPTGAVSYDDDDIASVFSPCRITIYYFLFKYSTKYFSSFQMAIFVLRGRGKRLLKDHMEIHAW